MSNFIKKLLGKTTETPTTLTKEERVEELNKMFTGGRTDEHLLKVEAGCQTIADFFGLDYKCSNHNPYMWSWNYVNKDSENCGRNPEGRIGEIFMPQRDWDTLMPYIAFFNKEELDKIQEETIQNLGEALMSNDCEKAFFALVDIINAQ
jgi:hypothetical protein